MLHPTLEKKEQKAKFPEVEEMLSSYLNERQQLGYSV
jgi:hypothetical protein